MPPPRFITCQLCGKGFGSASIDIHVPQCYEKSMKRWQLNPTGPPPVMPQMRGRGGAKGGRGVDGGFSGGMALNSRPCGNGVAAARTLRMDEMPPENQNLHACSHCNRKFNFDRIAYHESVCKGDKKRRVFDSSKQRTATDDGDSWGGFGGGSSRSYGRATGSKKKCGSGNVGNDHDRMPAMASKPPSKWRQEHEDFINAIRSARQAESQAKSMWGTSEVPSGGRPSAPTTVSRVPPSMARQNQMHQQIRAGGGRTNRGGGQAIPAPMAGNGRARTAARPAPSRAFGGGGDRFAQYGPGGAAGGGGYKVANDNTCSIGMLQAFGRA